MGSTTGIALLALLEIGADDTASAKLDEDTTGATELMETTAASDRDDELELITVRDDDDRDDTATTELVERAAGLSA